MWKQNRYIYLNIFYICIDKTKTNNLPKITSLKNSMYCLETNNKVSENNTFWPKLVDIISKKK